MLNGILSLRAASHVEKITGITNMIKAPLKKQNTISFKWCSLACDLTYCEDWEQNAAVSAEKSTRFVRRWLQQLPAPRQKATRLLIDRAKKHWNGGLQPEGGNDW